MNEKKKTDGTVIVVGAAACVACCAGPILAVLAAIGVSTGVGYALFGVGALAIGVAAAAFVIIRRRPQPGQSLPTRRTL